MSNTVQKSFFGGVGLTITFPAGVHEATFKGIGGGGGGGGGGGTDAAGVNSGGGGGGGGAAQMEEVTIPVIPNRQYNIALGTAGVGGTGVVSATGNDGTPGGDTIVTDSVSGFILCAFRGGSGGKGGSNITTGGLGGADASINSPGTNVFDTAADRVTPAGAKVPSQMCGGAGGDAGNPGNNGGFSPLQDSSIIGEAGQFLGGVGGGAVAVNGGGGGGGGGSSLGPGGDGGHGGADQGGNGGSPPGGATGAGGGGGGGSFADGVSRPGGNGANGLSGALFVFYDVAA